jgi:organic hydroperoxide reductase OsmC/OhrA
MPRQSTGEQPMSKQHRYQATVVWEKREGEKFTDNRYARAHQWQFDGGLSVAASSSPQVVPVPLSSENAVDPEEAFVASLSSCHMLFFLFHAARKGYVVERYEDRAEGLMGQNAEGRTAMLKVSLRPQIRWGGEHQPQATELDALHEAAHHDCFIANSVNCEVAVEAA